MFLRGRLEFLGLCDRELMKIGVNFNVNIKYSEEVYIITQIWSLVGSTLFYDRESKI